MAQNGSFKIKNQEHRRTTWQECVAERKRKRKKAQEEVNWAKYFAKIRGVCPWSYQAYMSDKILVVDYSDTDFKTFAKLFGHTEHEAFVYKCLGRSSEWLNKKCDHLNVLLNHCEWLWSHPEHEGDSTPIPVIIQQDKENLEKLREKQGYFDE